MKHDFKLLSEHQTHFEVSHPKHGTFKVAKNKLDEPTVKKIRKMFEGGKVQKYSEAGHVLPDTAEGQETNAGAAQDEAEDTPQEVSTGQTAQASPIAQPPNALDDYITRGQQAKVAEDVSEAKETAAKSAFANKGNDVLIGQRESLLQKKINDDIKDGASPEEIKTKYAGEMGGIASLKSQAEGAKKAAIPANYTPKTNPNAGSPSTGVLAGDKNEEAPSNPTADALGGYAKGFGLKAAGLEEEGKANIAGAGAQATAWDKFGGDIDKVNNDAQTHYAAWQAEDKRLSQAYMSGKIDPSRVWESTSTGNKIIASIGVLLSGIGSGLTGQPNMAMQVIQKTIDRDIEAQKDNLGKINNLLQLNLRKYGVMRDAEMATRTQLLTATQAHVNSIAASTKSAVAAAQAKQMQGELELEKQNLGYQLSVRTALNQGGSSDGVDPNQIRLALSVPGLIPKEAQAGILKEQNDYTKLKMSLQTVDKAFNQIADQQTLGNRTLRPIQTAEDIGSAKKLFSAQLAKDLEGRATPQDIESIMDNFPDLKDDATTRQHKLDRLKDSIKSKYGGFTTLQSFRFLRSNDPLITLSGSGSKPSDSRDYDLMGH